MITDAINLQDLSVDTNALCSYPHVIQTIDVNSTRRGHQRGGAGSSGSFGSFGVSAKTPADGKSTGAEGGDDDDDDDDMDVGMDRKERIASSKLVHVQWLQAAQGFSFYLSSQLWCEAPFVSDLVVVSLYVQTWK
jgi:hypothetical protein